MKVAEREKKACRKEGEEEEEEGDENERARKKMLKDIVEERMELGDM